MGQAVQPAPAGNEVHYERRRPEETTLYQVIQEHLESFLVYLDAERSTLFGIGFTFRTWNVMRSIASMQPISCSTEHDESLVLRIEEQTAIHLHSRCNIASHIDRRRNTWSLGLHARLIACALQSTAAKALNGPHRC